MSERILAVDPGSRSGAWAVLDEMGMIIAIDDLPIVENMISGPLFAEVIDRYTPSVAIIERVSSMPRQGIASAFKFGRGVGVIEGVLGASLVPVSWVAAGVWKKHFRLGKDKEASRALAIATWPEQAAQFSRKKDTHRAESALIGLWLARARVASA